MSRETKRLRMEVHVRKLYVAGQPRPRRLIRLWPFPSDDLGIDLHGTGVALTAFADGVEVASVTLRGKIGGPDDFGRYTRAVEFDLPADTREFTAVPFSPTPGTVFEYDLTLSEVRE